MNPTPNSAVMSSDEPFPESTGPVGPPPVPVGEASSDDEGDWLRPYDDDDDSASGGPRVDEHGILQSLRSLAQSNPEALQGLMTQAAGQYPGFIRLMQDNPEQFMELLQYAETARQANPTQPTAGAAAVIRLTPEENEAVMRLEEMGFHRNAVIQAYLACEKNENATANFLFDTLDEDNPDQPPNNNTQS